jgi:flagellar hook-length control protein FliK
LERTEKLEVSGMKILPTSPNSITAQEANPLSAKPIESQNPEKENFSLGQEETKLTTTETREELATEGPIALSPKPDFPYSLVAAVNFPLQTQVMPIGVTTDEQIAGEVPSSEILSLDAATALPKPILQGAPNGASIPLGRPEGKDTVRQPNDSDVSISAKWQKIGPNLDFAKLSPEFAAQNERLTAAIKNFDVPSFAKEIDLTSFWGGNAKGLGRLEPGNLPHAFSAPVISPQAIAVQSADIAKEPPLLQKAPDSDSFDWSSASQSAEMVDWKAASTKADTFDWSATTQNADMANWDADIVSSGFGGPKKLDPATVPVEEMPQLTTESAKAKKLEPIPLPAVEIPQLSGANGQTKKLEPTSYPVEVVPQITGANGQNKKLNSVAYPSVDTKPNLTKVDSENGIQWNQAEAAEVANYPTDEFIGVPGDAADEWNWAAESAGPSLSSTTLDPDASSAIGSLSKSIGEIRETKPSHIGGIESDQRLPDVATKRLVEVVADRLEAIAAAKPRSGVTIQLRPLDLGSITMIVKNAGNEVGAELYASHESVRQALDQNRAALSQQLEAKGMQLTNITVADSSLSNSTSTFADQNAQRTLQQNANQSSTLKYAEKEATIDPNQLLRKGKTDGVDYWI